MPTPHYIYHQARERQKKREKGREREKSRNMWELTRSPACAWPSSLHAEDSKPPALSRPMAEDQWPLAPLEAEEGKVYKKKTRQKGKAEGKGAVKRWGRLE